MRLQQKWKIDSKQLGMLAKKKQIQSVIYGLAIGDALGVPVEFRERGTYCITGMIGNGTYNQPLGTWSDDTSLTLALMEHLSEKSDLSALMDKFVAYREGYLTPYGECFDIGIATNQAIERYLSGVTPEECGGRTEMDNGNGALMRLSPLSLFLEDEYDIHKKYDYIVKYSSLTHAHMRSIVASTIYIQLLISLLHNHKFEVAIKNTKNLITDNFSSNELFVNEFETYYSKIFETDFFSTELKNIKSTGYVVDSLLASIWCVGTTGSFEESVLKAVNLGGDTDTIGAITGTLAGALYKVENIPEKWLNQIANKVLIDEKIKDFFEYFQEL